MHNWTSEPVSVRTVRPALDSVRLDNSSFPKLTAFFGLAGDNSPLEPTEVGNDSAFTSIDADRRSSSSIARFMTLSMRSVSIKLPASPAEFPAFPARMPVAEREENFPNLRESL